MHPHHRAPGRGRVSTGPHARWFRARLAGAGIIDMGAGEHASRVWRSRRAHRARAWRSPRGRCSPVCCATAGVVLSILPSGVSVAMTASTYRIGDATLHAVAPGVYSGAGTLVLGHSGSDLIAGGSAVVDGVRWVAFCDVATGGAAETCRLQSGTRTLDGARRVVPRARGTARTATVCASTSRPRGACRCLSRWGADQPRSRTRASRCDGSVGVHARSAIRRKV